MKKVSVKLNLRLTVVFLSVGLFLVLAMIEPTYSSETKSDEKAVIIKINPEKTLNKINPFMYGQQIEFMGTCIDEGIWAELLRRRKLGKH